LGGGDQEDYGLKPAQQIVLKTLSQKNPTQNRAGRVAQVVEHLPSKSGTLSSNSNMAKKKGLFSYVTDPEIK
jgi:DNA-binding MarR family transcriptional regulator